MMMRLESPSSLHITEKFRTCPPVPEAGSVRDTQVKFAAVLFADIKGFTRFCQSVDPHTAFRTLSTFHRRMAAVISEHSATVTTSAGDEVMAAWCGTPSAVASQALRCGFAMLRSVESWNRHDYSLDCGLNIGVGLHAGHVALGRIPGVHESRLSVFGDTVNVASRLEQLTRAYPTDLIASDELIRNAGSMRPESGADRFEAPITAELRDRSGLLKVRIAR